jgi:hypothetical protein
MRSQLWERRHPRLLIRNRQAEIKLVSWGSPAGKDTCAPINALT